jgi:hypothetical protein
MTISLGRLELLSPRDVWRHEERDFTPWLAENVSLLSDVIGVRIVVDQIEHRVGSYELDILGRVDESDAIVVIENQLGTTDHSHLGQLLAYAAGLEASIIIWVAGNVRDEHRSTIDWLNQHTGPRTSFFLVRPEVLRVDGSKPAVRFVLEASPSEFARDLQELAIAGARPSHEFRTQFWAGLLEHLRGAGQTWASGRSATKDAWIAFAVGRSGIGTHASMALGSRMRVEIYCTDDPDKVLFGKLAAHKTEIESMFAGEVVSWEPLEGKLASRVAVYRPYDKEAISTASHERDELYKWITKQLLICRQATRQFLLQDA